MMSGVQIHVHTLEYCGQIGSENNLQNFGNREETAPTDVIEKKASTLVVDAEGEVEDESGKH